MRIRNKLIVSVAFLTALSLLAAETNYLEIVMKLSPEESRDYIRSLPRDAVWTMASQAYEKDWNEYGIAVGILQEAFGQQPLTREETVSVIENPKLHPGLRGSMAAGGMELAKEWRHEDFLDYVDVVICFYQDKHIEYRWKTKIPDYTSRAMGRRIDALVQEFSFDQSAMDRLDQLHVKAAQFVEYFIGVLRQTSDPQECSLEGVGIIDFIRLYLEKERVLPPTEASKKAICLAYEGREVLVEVLRDPKCSPSIAKGVLRRAEEIRLWEVLSEGDIAAMKSDGRFSDAETCRTLSRVEEQITERSAKNSDRTHPPGTATD